MLRRLYFLTPKIAYSFPVQLFLNNLKRNQVLLLCWIILFAMITGSFGKYLGIPYLFLDPEYLNKVNFRSFFIMGMVIAGFSTAFHITCYINDGHRFSFVGTLSRPFTKFVINNSFIPATFLVTYLIEVISFQQNNQYVTGMDLFMTVTGILVGYAVMTLLFFVYFRLTNKDIFKYVVCRIDERIKQSVKVTRASVMKRLDIARKRQERVDYYVDEKFRFKKVEDTTFYDKQTILQVFDQNQFNLVIIEVLIFALIVILGIFKDSPAFQLPAAASCVIFLTVFVMLAGAFEYWFGNWASTAALALFLFFNYLVGEGVFSKQYKAFGLDYDKVPIEYSIERLQKLNDSTFINQDREATMVMLNNWRKKFDKPPKLAFVCVSGGGKRAALWALNSLQTADSLTSGALMKQSVLVTGASGGLIGASYFRELKLRETYGENVKPYSSIHRDKISTDNLNPLIFSLLANDLFVGFTQFVYADNAYEKDRAYTFEQQLNQITEGMMDKPISAYRKPEDDGVIPMVVLTPTVVNDGRKMYIASRPVSFFNADILDLPGYRLSKISGTDFQRAFASLGADSLRFLSALRMSATFPYITPNTTLPTDPPIQIMDAGISDNFGMNDAVRFLYSFREWIAENTSGVVFVSIRDSPKLGKILPKTGMTIVDDITQPISSVYNNFENFQDINADLLIGQARAWFKLPIARVDLQYQAESYVPILQKMDSIRQNSARASLSWRLTTREKEGIVNAINSEANQLELARLKGLLK
ncbi:MAG: patatin-like phospholipase family protein [Bacteroidota bacterium]